MSSRDYLLRERVRGALEWQEAIEIAQASEAARLSNYAHSVAVAISNTSAI